MNAARLATAVLGSLALALACSSGSASPGAGGSGRTSTCSEFCSRSSALGCLSGSAEECTTQCQASAAEQPAACVPSQLGSLMCGLDAFGCNFINVDTFQLIDACTAEFASYGNCSACLADEDDDPCDTCEKTSCCSQRKAMFGDASVLEWSVCAYQCQDTACIESCGNAHPGAEAKAQAYAECTSSACPSC